MKVESNILAALDILDMHLHEMPINSNEIGEIFKHANKDGFRFFNDFRNSHFVMDNNGDIACIGNVLSINAQLNKLLTNTN